MSTIWTIGYAVDALLRLVGGRAVLPDVRGGRRRRVHRSILAEVLVQRSQEPLVVHHIAPAGFQVLGKRPR